MRGAPPEHVRRSCPFTTMQSRTADAQREAAAAYAPRRCAGGDAASTGQGAACEIGAASKGARRREARARAETASPCHAATRLSSRAGRGRDAARAWEGVERGGGGGNG